MALFNKKDNELSRGKSIKVQRPMKNVAGRWLTAAIIIMTTAALIYWVNDIGEKAERTVPVVMINADVFKNAMISEEMLTKYDMILAEYENYTYSEDKSKRRIILWDERNKIIGTFAAFPIQKDTVAMYRQFVKSRVDNKDTVMYSFPGKYIVPLDIQSNEIDSFKRFLQPGDKLNIEAIYLEKVKEETIDAMGTKVMEEREVFRVETVFESIAVAELLNKSGYSILDIYQEYNNLTVWDQVKRDSDPAFQEAITPDSLLLALTPEEKIRYFYFFSKPDIQFKVTLPQRTE